jgi:integrase
MILLLVVRGDSLALAIARQDSLRNPGADDLASAVPRVAFWSLATLPKYLPPDGVDQVLDRCNNTTPIGKRNHAILLILARLGLRSCEVVDLRLDDLDWEKGVVRVRSSKGGRWTSMPLPTEVGQSLAAYLEQARPFPSAWQLT